MMKMIEVLGLPPQHLLSDAPKVSKYFDRLADGMFVPKRPQCEQVGRAVVSSHQNTAASVTVSFNWHHTHY